MKKNWLSWVNLSDAYEGKTRLLPAVLSVLPLYPVAAVFNVPFIKGFKITADATLLYFALAVGASHIASALGNRIQTKIWPDWPHGSPTNRRLHPDNKVISVQQKNRWYHAIKDLTGLDIAQVIEIGDRNEIRAVINDAVAELRSRFWKAPEAERLRLHNVDYGFARNLAGLRVVWLPLAIASFGGCWIRYVMIDDSILWPLVSTIIAIGTVAIAPILPSYVLRKADYYAESFFFTVVKLSKKRSRE